MVKVNLKFKDRLFRLLFGSEEYKDNILSLYNALHQTSYDNLDDISITTIDDVIYIKMKNDVSILIDSMLSLWEQQSTYNPNMPIRGLMYFGELYNSYINDNHINIYKSKLVPLPTPSYYVFYNGSDEHPAIEKMKLSDAFIHPNTLGDFEWTATVINLNKGKNDDLLSKCKPLSDYMTLVNKINEYKKQYSIKDAIDKAIDECIESGVLSEFLKHHKMEVLDMALREFDETLYEKDLKEEGIEQERRQNINNMREEGFSNSEIARILKLSLEEIEKY